MLVKKAIFAVLFHVCSSEKNNFHVHCPPGADSSCTYQLDLVNNTKLHKPGKGFPQEAIKHLTLIFSDLSDDNLLRKCLHGKTQNQNEGFHGLIWRRPPKDRFVKMTTFELAVYDAVAHSDIGNLATQLIFDKLNMKEDITQL